MAKKAKSKSNLFAAAKVAKPQTAKKAARKGGRATKRSTGDTKIEKRWQEYWRLRGELEEACDAVGQAEVALREATELERTSRDTFEQSKTAVQELLDVAPPSLEEESP